MMNSTKIYQLHLLMNLIFIDHSHHVLVNHNFKIITEYIFKFYFIQKLKYLYFISKLVIKIIQLTSGLRLRCSPSAGSS